MTVAETAARQLAQRLRHKARRVWVTLAFYDTRLAVSFEVGRRRHGAMVRWPRSPRRRRLAAHRLYLAVCRRIASRRNAGPARKAAGQAIGTDRSRGEG